MKLKLEILIDAALDRVWAAFDNPDNMRRWQQNFHSYTHKAGKPGQPGAIAELVFDENGRKVILQETITERRAPDFRAATYESGHGTSIIVNHFEAVDGNKTRWSSWGNFKFTGFMRYLSLFIGPAFRRRTEGDMARFKLMVESDEAGTA